MTTTTQKYPAVVSVVNLKGGVGKTTLCVNLAYGLAYYARKRVLLVDLDPQANATQYLISQQAYRKVYLSEPATRLTIVDLYNELGGLATAAKPIKNPDRFLQRVYTGDSGYLDLVASKLDLGLLAFEGGNVLKNDQVRLLVAQVGERYDIVLIDCPPTVSRMLTAGFEASDYVLIPIKPDFLSTIGLPLLHKVIADTYALSIARRQEWQRPTLSVLGIVYTMFDGRLTMTIESVRDVEVEAKKLKYTIFDARISDSTKFTWSAKRTLPIFRTEPSSRYADEIHHVVDEFLARLKEIS
jgi:chromosome partitioning protein